MAKFATKTSKSLLTCTWTLLGMTHMKYLIAGLLLCFSVVTYSAEPPRATLETNLGTITIELDYDRAPISVHNFVDYAQAGTYNGTIFHRVIKDFMIQAGGYTKDYQKVTTDEPIINEATNGLKNLRGTVAMARTAEPHSATSQFFINVKDNNFLNHTSKSPRGWGYAIFGKVIDGMEIVDKIQALKTGSAGELTRHVPRQMVIINSVTLSNLPDFSAPPSKITHTETVKVVEEKATDEKGVDDEAIDEEEDTSDDDVIDEEDIDDEEDAVDDATDDEYVDDEDADIDADEDLDDVTDDEDIDSEDADLEEDLGEDETEVTDETDAENDVDDEEIVDEEDAIDSEEDTDTAVVAHETIEDEESEDTTVEETPIKEEPKSPPSATKTPNSNAMVPPDPPSKPDMPEPPA